jgi:hypothetical protein
VKNVHATVTQIFGFISSVQLQWETVVKGCLTHTNIMAAKVRVDAISTSTTMGDLWSEILGRRTELEGYCRYWHRTAGDASYPAEAGRALIQGSPRASLKHVRSDSLASGSYSKFYLS